MISKQEFIVEMKRLEIVFGEDSYPRPRIVLLYEASKALSQSDFAHVVSDLIGRCRFPPLLIDFQESIKKVRLENFRNEGFFASQDDSYQNYQGAPNAHQIATFIANIKKEIYEEEDTNE